MRIDNDDLAGLDLTLVLGADEVERAGLGSEDDGGWGAVITGDATEDEGAKAVRVADGEELVGGEEKQGIGAAESGARLGKAREKGAGL